MDTKNILDTRNVVNKYKGWELDLIREDIKKNTFPYSVLMYSLDYDFNIATFIRNANAFGAKRVFYHQPKKKIDTRGCCGVNHYTDIHYVRSEEDIVALKCDYHLVAVEIVDKAVPITKAKYKENTLFLFGSESNGLPQSLIDICEQVVYIPQYGSVRSLNTGCASAIIMNDFVTKWTAKNYIKSKLKNLKNMLLDWLTQFMKKD